MDAKDIMAAPSESTPPQLVQYMYYDSSKTQRGPAMGAEMKYLFEKGIINEDSFIWTTGMPEWKPLKDSPLASYVKQLVKPKPQEQKTDSKSEELPKKKKKKKKKRSSRSWIYVTGIPKDVTEEELENHFAKCGLLQEDAMTGKPLIKLYRSEDTGEIKGDASICFVQEASVELALSVLDEAPLRSTQADSTKLKVSRADFSKSEQKTKDNDEGSKQTGKRKNNTEWERRVKLRKLNKQQALSWNEEGLADNQGLRIVVVKHLFDPKEIKHSRFLADLEEALVSECKKCGEIAKITIIEKNPEGIAIVKYESARGAEKCVELLNGRWFDKRKIVAEFWDGFTDYRVRATEEEENQRIESFGDWLESKADESND